MKIAYYSHYVGREFARRAGIGQKNGGSGSLKTQGMARAMLKAGHQVTIYSPGITECNKYIKGFQEVEHYPEGDLVIKYPNILSYRGCNFINDLSVRFLLQREKKSEKFDAFVFYNIEDSWKIVGLFKKSDIIIRILEYEDHFFNDNYKGSDLSAAPSKKKKSIYKYVLNHTDAVFAVCMGMYNDPVFKHKILTPAVINDEVIETVSHEPHSLRENKPTRLFLIGGGHFCKGADVLVKSLHYVKNPCNLVFYTNPIHFNDEAQTMIKSLPSHHSVEIRGLIPHKELMQILNDEADILMNCTRSFGLKPQMAGFPSKMMEYAAMGRPIVSSEIGRLDEKFNSHITYYEGDDPKSLASSIDYVINNYPSMDTKALDLQRLAIENYSIAGIARVMGPFLDKIENIYKK